MKLTWVCSSSHKHSLHILGFIKNTCTPRPTHSFQPPCVSEIKRPRSVSFWRLRSDDESLLESEYARSTERGATGFLPTTQADRSIKRINNPPQTLWLHAHSGIYSLHAAETSRLILWDKKNLCSTNLLKKELFIWNNTFWGNRSLGCNSSWQLRKSRWVMIELPVNTGATH